MLATRGHSFYDYGDVDDVGIIETDKNIRKTFSTSGLYMTGTNTPLWTVSWYAFDTYLSTDGEHVVRIGPWASSTKQLAVAFYSNGKEIKRYLIREVVKGVDKLQHTVSHFFWMDKCELDDHFGLFRIRTVESIDYTFSISTGEVVSITGKPSDSDSIR